MAGTKFNRISFRGNLPYFLDHLFSTTVLSVILFLNSGVGPGARNEIPFWCTDRSGCLIFYYLLSECRARTLVPFPAQTRHNIILLNGVPDRGRRRGNRAHLRSPGPGGTCNGGEFPVYFQYISSIFPVFSSTIPVYYRIFPVYSSIFRVYLGIYSLSDCSLDDQLMMKSN